jgi:hypothetical protein
MLGPLTEDRSIFMKMRFFFYLLSMLSAGLMTSSAVAWGPLGHAEIGQAGVTAAEPGVRAAVAGILGVDSPAALDAAIDTACNWPDAVRETPEWAWTAPLHFVNIPRGVAHYDRQRDCPDGLCVTEGILRYAAELARPEPDGDEADPDRRWRAFAWLCHLVADLHQPLHAGFRDDRGGNQVDVKYRGETWDLHEFWDGVLARERYRDSGQSLQAAGDIPAWRPEQVATWTDESHALAETVAYPPDFVDGMEIDDGFADRSWALSLTQWRTAAGRLAAILDVVLAPTAPES